MAPRPGLGAARVTGAARLGARVARHHMGEHPLLLPLALRYPPGGRQRAITSATEVVIDGYPRSGNSFAVAAFRWAQPGRVEVAHHTHYPAQIRVAVERGLPTVVVIRDPADAASSLVIAAPHLPVKRALTEWVRFYRRVLPIRDGFVLATFERVTSDYGTVIDALNQRFGTAFARFEHTHEHVDSVFGRIDRRNATIHGGEIAHTDVPRPTAARSARREELLAELARPQLASAVAQARALYAEMVAADEVAS